MDIDELVEENEEYLEGGEIEESLDGLDSIEEEQIVDILLEVKKLMKLQYMLEQSTTNDNDDAMA